MNESEIQKAFRLFHGPARNAMSIDHRSPYVAVAEKGLDRADIVVRLKEMRSEGLAEGVGGNAFGKFGAAH